MHTMASVRITDQIINDGVAMTDIDPQLISWWNTSMIMVTIRVSNYQGRHYETQLYPNWDATHVADALEALARKFRD